MDFEQRLIEAQLLQARGALEQAAGALENLIADGGARRSALALLGRIRLAQGRPEEAAALMEAVLRRTRHRAPPAAQLTLGLPSHTHPPAPVFIDDDDAFDTEIAAARHAERGTPESVEDRAAPADAQTDPTTGPAALPTPEPGQAERAVFEPPSSDPRHSNDFPLPLPVAPSSATTAQPTASINGTDPQPPRDRAAPVGPGRVPSGEARTDAVLEPILDDKASNRLFPEDEPDADGFNDPDDFAEVVDLDDGLDEGPEDLSDEEDNEPPFAHWYDPDLDPDPIPPSRPAASPPQATIPRRERARQIAIQVAAAAAAEPSSPAERRRPASGAARVTTRPTSDYAWAVSENIELLTDIFFCYGWGLSRIAIEREIAAGMSPQELHLAFELRKSWSDNPEFAMDFTAAARSLSQTTAAVYRVISWPLALKMIRSHHGMTDRESIAWALFDLFDEWYSNPSHYRRWPSFNLFLYSQLGGYDEVLEEFPEWHFEPDPMLATDDEENWCPGVGTPTYRILEQTGLLPGNGAASDFKDQAPTGSD